MKIKMTVEKNGYPEVGETLDVSEDRAARWVLDMGIAEFVERKDRVSIAKKIDDAKAEAEKEDKEVQRKLDAMED